MFASLGGWGEGVGGRGYVQEREMLAATHTGTVQVVKTT